MYTWYNQAEICFAHLADVPSQVDLSRNDSEFHRTDWATRGWTLQELLAPKTMTFYSSDWQEIGTRLALSSILSAVTGIDEEYFMQDSATPFSSASVAKRMSWASRRETSRPEDIAYCLMGLFQVNMPLLYGEGDKAFIRLQEEIMKHSDDHSLFAWTDLTASTTSPHGLLAKHPRCFAHSGSIAPYEDRESREPFSMSNRGLRIELHLQPTTVNGRPLYAAALDCPVPPDYDDATFLAIYLKKLPFTPGQYARVNVANFGSARPRGRLETIFVRQNIVVPSAAGVFPTHVLQLRKFAPQGPGYRVARTLARDKSIAGVARAIKTTQSASDWLPVDNAFTCKMSSKRDSRALFGVQIVFEGPKERESIVVLLGSANLHVGFNLVQTASSDLSAEEKRELFEREFVPFRAGSNVEAGYHRVRVSAEPRVSIDAKYYMIDIEVEELERPPTKIVDEVIDIVEDFVKPLPSAPDEGRRSMFQALKRPFGGRKAG